MDQAARVVGETGEGGFRNSVVMWLGPPDVMPFRAARCRRNVEREGVLLLHLFHTTCVVGGTGSRRSNIIHVINTEAAGFASYALPTFPAPAPVPVNYKLLFDDDGQFYFMPATTPPSHPSFDMMTVMAPS
jgi:hypothetical protein